MPVEAARTRGIDKSSFAGIAKQPALPHAGDENVGKAIVVIIADSHAHSIELNVEARTARHVGERAVAVVTVEPKRRALAFARTERSERMARPIHAVDEKDVLPAVVVVIETRAARAQRLREQFADIRAA